MNTELTPLAGWSPAEQQMLLIALQHVQAAIAAGELPAQGAGTAASVGAATGADEGLRWLAPLQQMLMAQRAQPASLLGLFAQMLASACMGPHHLWQDLGLQGRSEVSRLLALSFPALFHSNTSNLRWKRHLFLCLGQTVGLAALKPPKCGHCDDYAICMGAPQV